MIGCRRRDGGGGSWWFQWRSETRGLRLGDGWGKVRYNGRDISGKGLVGQNLDLGYFGEGLGHDCD